MNTTNQLADYLMRRGVLKNSDAEVMAREIEAEFAKERDAALAKCAEMRELISNALDARNNPYAWPLAIWTHFCQRAEKVLSDAPAKGYRRVKYRSAVSGMLYDDPKAAGDISEVVIDGRPYHIGSLSPEKAKVLVEALNGIVESMLAHDAVFHSCDRDGNDTCDCLGIALKRAQEALAQVKEIGL